MIANDVRTAAEPSKLTAPNPAEAPPRPRPTAPHPASPRPGALMPEREEGEIRRRFDSFCMELQPSGELGRILIGRAATLSVRLERSVRHENATLADRVRRAFAEFVPPAGIDAAELARLRRDVEARAMYDSSPEAAQARAYEASTERSFLRVLKELRQIEKAAKDLDAEFEAELAAEKLGSSLSLEQLVTRFDALYPDRDPSTSKNAPGRASEATSTASEGRVDVPITIGRPR